MTSANGFFDGSADARFELHGRILRTEEIVEGTVDDSSNLNELIIIAVELRLGIHLDAGLVKVGL